MQRNATPCNAMQLKVSEQFISRDEAIRQLSRIRYPGMRRDIDRSTLSRWRNVARVRATKNFNAEEWGRLMRVASLAYQGLSYEQIKTYIGGSSHHDSAKARNQDRNQDRSKAPESSHQWGDSSLDDLAAQFR